MTGLKKGTIYLVIGWTVQLFTGYLLNIWLARYLGPEGFGMYGVVMSLLLWIEVGVISGFPTAVQKFVSANERKVNSILRIVNRYQFIYILVIFVLSFFVAPLISNVLKDGHLKFYLRIAIWDIWIYGFYFVFFSLQNGLRQFGKQAILISLYSISKLGFVILFVSVTNSVTGALVANIAGSAVGLLVGLLWARKELFEKDEDKSDIENHEIVKFAVPVAFYALVVNLLLNVDLWLVKYFLGTVSSAYYVSASVIARIPYYLFFGLSATILPVLSRAISEKNTERIQQVIYSAIRYLSIFVLPLSLLTLAFGREVIVLLFSGDYSAGGDVLRILIFGMSALALFSLFTTVINADNRPIISFSITGIVLVLDIVSNVILIPLWGTVGAAVSTTVAFLVGSVIAGIIVIKRFQVSINKMMLMRITIASFIIYFCSLFFNVQGFMVFVVGVILFVFYCFLLFIMGEINVREIRESFLKN